MDFLGAGVLRQARRHRRLLAVIAGAGGLFAEVAHELREDRLQADHGFPFDRPVLQYLHHHSTPTRCTLANELSALGGAVWLSLYARPSPSRAARQAGQAGAAATYCGTGS